MKKNFLFLSAFLILLVTLTFPSLAHASHCTSVQGLADPTCTPGSTNPAITQANITATICTKNYTTKVRPPVAYTENLKKQQIKLYGYIDTKLAHYEEDHFIPLELGGSPKDPKNLWPEPISGRNSSLRKDKLENSLHTQVCKGTMTLLTAQKQIVAQWENNPLAPAVSTPTTQVSKKSSKVKRIFSAPLALPTRQAVLPTASPPLTTPTPSAISTTTTTSAPPNQATGLCTDGTLTYAVHHQGACSHHGGVTQWY